MSTAVENRYLVGNFAPVSDELSATDLPVQGAIPKELRGRLLRNGPNPIAPDPAAYHWFMGDGMLHAIELRDGKAVSYRNRWVRTDQALGLLGEDPIPGQPEDVFPVGSSVANTHVVTHAGKIFALVEVCLPTQVRPDLSTVGRYDFGGKLRSAMTAHPKVDPVTGEMLFFGYDAFGPPWLRYHVVNANGELVRSEDDRHQWSLDGARLRDHRNNIVFLDLPVVFDFDLVGKRPFPAEWKPDYGARVGVMPRDGGNADVRWFDVEPCYVFHPLNAYDDDNGTVVIDVARHPKMFDKDIYGPAELPPTLDRWTIDLDAGKVIEERLDDRPQEFPRVDDRVRRPAPSVRVCDPLRHRRRGDPARRSGEARPANRHDRSAQLRSRHACRRRRVRAGRGRRRRRRGRLLSVVYDEGRDASDLVVLDATDISGSPVATVTLPQRVPFGFHGSWIPDSLV